MPTNIIVHHYPESPYSEKLRLILGAKQLTWHSVTIPMIMPKPDLLALTGGYRRTPVMQVGCDIYCDTRLIAETLERLAPAVPLFDARHAAQATMAAHWVESQMFSAAATFAMQPGAMTRMFPDPSVMAPLFEDRKAFLAGGSAQLSMPFSEAVSILIGAVDWLEQELKAGGKPFFGGDRPAMFDFTAHHPLWFVDRTGMLDDLLANHPRVKAWFERVCAIGHGTPLAMSGAEAIAEVRRAQPAPLEAFESIGLDGLKPGDAVEVAATDYGVDPTSGTLLTATRRTFVIAREDARAGKVYVHFPRIGFRIGRC